jgi:hypothetical protein
MLLKSTLSLTAVLAALASPVLAGLVDWQNDVPATEAPQASQDPPRAEQAELERLLFARQEVRLRDLEQALRAGKAGYKQLVAEQAELEKLVLELQNAKVGEASQDAESAGRLWEREAALQAEKFAVQDAQAAKRRGMGRRIEALRSLDRDKGDLAAKLERLEVLERAARSRVAAESRVSEAMRPSHPMRIKAETDRRQPPHTPKPAPTPPATPRTRTADSEVTIIVEQGDVHVHMAASDAPRVVRSSAPRVREIPITTRGRLAPKPPEPPADLEGATGLEGRFIHLNVGGKSISGTRLRLTPTVNKVIELRANLEVEPNLFRSIQLNIPITPDPEAEEPAEPETCPDDDPSLVSAPALFGFMPAPMPAPAELAVDRSYEPVIFPTTGRLQVAGEVVTFNQPSPDELLQRIMGLVEDLTHDVETLRAEVQGLRGDIHPAPRRSTGGIR